MKIVINTREKQEVFDQEVANLLQFYNFVSENHPEVKKFLDKNELCYALIDNSGKKRLDCLRPQVLSTPFEGYDILYIGERIEGAFFVAPVIVLGVVIQAATLNAILVSVVFMVISMALTMLLTPNKSFQGDGATQRKSMLLNGIPNVDEQGGAIPIVVGECFFGGVRVGANVSTVDIALSGNDASLDTTVPEIAQSAIKTSGNGQWFRVE